MRRIFTTQMAYAEGLSKEALRWKVATGTVIRISRGVFIDGPDRPSHLEVALASVVVTGGIACGTLAARLHGLDSVELAPPFVAVVHGRALRRKVKRLPADVPTVEVSGFPCTDGLQTLVDLADSTDDSKFEQALESALRKRIVEPGTIDAVVRSSFDGVKRMRRVWATRPHGAPPTESLLETLMVQLIRRSQQLPAPERQVEVFDSSDRFVARVDLAWTEVGVFIELDGQQHKDQPEYDARRETAVVACKGWFPARFTWREVVHMPNTTLKRLVDIYQTAASVRAGS
jgi:hypothetical protein